jgi:hypothetical protein
VILDHVPTLDTHNKQVQITTNLRIKKQPTSRLHPLVMSNPVDMDLTGGIDDLEDSESAILDITAVDEYRLYSREIYWREHYFWFKERGYLLRPRYHPEWVASWKDTGESWLEYEDAQVGLVM